VIQLRLPEKVVVVHLRLSLENDSLPRTSDGKLFEALGSLPIKASQYT